VNNHASRRIMKVQTRERSAHTAIPVNVDAERAVLGAILEMESLFRDVVAAGLAGEDFSLGDHARVYTAMIRLGEANQPIDHISVAGKLGNCSEDIALLSDLIAGVVLDRNHILYHVGTIIEKSRLRQIQGLGEEIQVAVSEPGVVPLDLALEIVTKLNQIIGEKTMRGASREPSAHKETSNEQWKNNTTAHGLQGESCGRDSTQTEPRSERP
jgi:replicative DNA helicase